LDRNCSEVLSEIGVAEGQSVMDFGCGSGTYSIPAAKLVGKKGRVYSLDVSKSALKKLSSKAESKGLDNIITLLSTGKPEIPIDYESLNHVLLIDVLQEIPNKERLFEEIHRVLKPQGEFFLLDWNEFSLSEAPFFFRLPFKHLECSHATDFITQDWRAVLTHKGFEDLEEHLFFWQYVRMIRERKISSGTAK